MTTVRTVIHDRRIEIPAPDDLADGKELILTIGTDVFDEEGRMSPCNARPCHSMCTVVLCTREELD